MLSKYKDGFILYFSSQNSISTLAIIFHYIFIEHSKINMCEESNFTCNKVVDDSIGAFICIHCPGYIPNHSTLRRLLRHRQQLVRQAAALRWANTQGCREDTTNKLFNSSYSVQITLTYSVRESHSLVASGRQVHCHRCLTAPPAKAVWSRKALAGPGHGPL